MHQAIAAAVATVLLMYVFPPVADAQELPEKSERILIVADETQVDRMNTLADVLRSHFRDLNAEVEAVAVSLPQKDLPAQVETVRALVVFQGALSGIWIEESSDEIFLFVSDKLTKKVLVQTFDSGKESWEVECETVAALVRSALITWLEVVPPPPAPVETPTPFPEPPKETPKAAPEPPKETPEEKREVEAVVKEETQEAAKEERAVRPPRGKIERTRRQRRPRHERHRAPSGPAPKRRPVVGIVDAAFATRMLHPDEPWTYNARLGSRLQLFETVSLGASVEVGTPSNLDIPNIDEEVLLRRVPISTDARFTHAFGRFGIEAGLALDICFSYFDDNPGWGGTPNSTLTTYGLGTFLAGTFRVVKHLSLFAGVGVDFYFRTSRYLWNTESYYYVDDTLYAVQEAQPVFTVAPTQLFLVLGLAVDFGK